VIIERPMAVVGKDDAEKSFVAYLVDFLGVMQLDLAISKNDFSNNINEADANLDEF
jgi:hypothetical protein